MTSEIQPTPRKPMEATSEPTDEELQLVMREARDMALQRKQASDEWMQRRLAAAVAEARMRMRAN